MNRPVFFGKIILCVFRLHKWLHVNLIIVFLMQKFETGDVAGLIKPISVDIGIRGTCGTCVNRLVFFKKSLAMILLSLNLAYVKPDPAFADLVVDMRGGSKPSFPISYLGYPHSQIPFM